MTPTPTELFAACVLDALIGDPRWLPHPVRGMGWVITWYESGLRSMTSNPILERTAGILLAVGLPATVYVLASMLIQAAGVIHPWVRTAIIIGLSSSTLAARDLIDHALGVSTELCHASIERARVAVSQIVGRDTDQLTESEVVRATVETIAESTSDGVIAPLLYLVIGGPPMALAFKAVSTLDSMIGYLNPPYTHFGWAAARLDDVLNWLPARITGLLFVLAAGVLYQRMAPAWRILARDGGKHSSPNSGRPEAAMAGALGVQLGGCNWYAGQPCERPTLGESEISLSPVMIHAALRIMIVASVAGVGLALTGVSMLQ